MTKQRTANVKKTKKRKYPKSYWWVGQKFFKGLSFGDSTKYADAARRVSAEKQGLGKPN